MSDVTRILNACSEDPKASDELLPLVYQELRKLAASRMQIALSRADAKCRKSDPEAGFPSAIVFKTAIGQVEGIVIRKEP